MSQLHHGLPSFRYGNGDVYSGHWSCDQRVGFGRLEENSLKRSFYIGSWSNDKRNGYGIYEDKMRSVETVRNGRFDKVLFL